jgi:hypothetical protein
MSDAARIGVVFLLIDYIAGTYLFVLAYREYPLEGSLGSWLGLYFFGVMQPACVAVLHYRWLNKRAVEWTRALRFFVVAPIIAGGVTLLYAIDLIHRVARIAAR